MMHALFFCIVLGSPVAIQDMEIYRPLERRYVTLTPDGTVFVLHRDQGRVLRFGEDGTPLPPFAGPGEGPGELLHPTSVSYVAGQIVIQDSHGLNLFLPSGEFLRRGVGRPQLMAKTLSGALGVEYTWASPVLTDAPTIFGYDSSLLQSTRLDEVARARAGTVTTSIHEKGHHQVRLVIASAKMIMAGHSSGKRVFVFPSGGDVIHVYDGSHKRLAPISLPHAPKFNEAWGDKAFAELMAKQRNGSGLDLKRVDPDRFPALRTMNLLGDTLYVVLWSEAPDRLFPVRAYDLDGQPAEARFNGLAVHQIVGMHGEWVWLRTWDAADERAGLKRVPLSSVNGEVKASGHPWNDWREW